MSFAAPPPRRRSSTFSAIASWAAHVQPGSPSPTPIRRAHRPSSPDIAVDLTGLGYTSVFVNLLQTPMPKVVNPDSFPPPARPRPSRLKGLRSLSKLRSRSNSTATTTLPPSPAPLESPKITAASIATRKKAVYAFAKPSKSKPQTPSSSKPKTGLPPALAYELALMQFADGGSTEENIKRLMQARARAAAPAGAKETVVSDVYRDDKGGVWLDREQEMEYVHLLGGHDASRVAGPEKWVSFGGEVKEGRAEDDDDEERSLAIANFATDGRRGSAISNASVDLGDIIKPAEEDAKIVRVPLPPLTTPSPARAAREPILTIPSRPRHARHHLRASPSFFLLDLNAFSVPRTPRTPRTPHTPHPPRTPHTPRAPAPPAVRHTEHPSQPQPHPQRCRGAARRRPAPLNIVAHVPVRGVSPDHGSDENGDARKDFLEASFCPAEMQMDVPVSLPAKMHREAVYRGPAGLSESCVWGGQESWRALKKKTSRPFLSLFGLK